MNSTAKSAVTCSNSSATAYRTLQQTAASGLASNESRIAPPTDLGVMWRQRFSTRRLIGVSTEVTHATAVGSNSDRPVQRLRSAQGRGHVHDLRSESLHVRPLRRAGGSTADATSTAAAASTASGRGTLPILSSASVEGWGHECRLGHRLRRLPRGDGADTGRSWASITTCHITNVAAAKGRSEWCALRADSYWNPLQLNFWH